ncbi:phage tail protein [Brevibacillus ruminantium]|uniref:Phage tail protein n=1 Tax=Brevibacillus ruminantium TaxID=2950604 RepID=A0ABY4WN23_9BACL|nr:phage tail protein [Brevibacillus ruminantium]USG67457.1 phage tail protein [Brevibacillus ruminantium]
MGKFNGSVLTVQGLALQTKAQLGEATIQFTRIGIGDGYIEEELRTLKKLVNERKSLPIINMKNTGEGQTAITAALNNQDLASGFYLREIGLFARNPEEEEEELLYAVAYAGEQADYLPQGNGADVVEEIIRFITVIGNAAEVTALIDEKALVTVDVFERHVHDKEMHISRSELQAELSLLRNRILLIESIFPDNFKHNHFYEDLDSLDAITLKRGFYNEAASRLEV